MKRITPYFLINQLILVLAGGLFVSTALAATQEVPARGVAEPPFLTEGIPANLLLFIDNSASMYDMAYDDIEEPGFCNDDSYIPEGTIAQDEWDPIAYKEGTFVHVPEWIVADEAWKKNWYRATVDIAAGGAEPDGSGSWSSAAWSTGTDYLQGAIVVIQEQFVQDDGSVLYTYKWYKATRAATEAGDAAAAAGDPLCYASDPQTNLDCWRRIPSMYGGYFENDQWYQWNDGEQRFVKVVAQPVDSNAACSALASQERYRNDDLCEVIEPYGFSYKLIDFVAKGNYLNWLASSKLDVEKKVLTGGKYESFSDNLVMESRGCLGRRMIRQVPAENDAGDPKFLTMAVAQGEESSSGNGASLNDCLTGCTPADATCVNDCSNSCPSGCQDLVCIQTAIDDLATCQADDPRCSSSSSIQRQRCQDDCAVAYDIQEAACAPDAACVTACESDCSTACVAQCENECTDSWANVGIAAEISRIQFFPPMDDGFQFGNSACEAAISETQLGQVQNLAEDCLEIGKQNESFANSNAAFNHGFQTCWGYPTVGTGDITRMINACENIYREGVDPTDIEITDSGYVCMGDNDDASGYIGRCFTGLTPDGTGNCSYTTCTDSSDPSLGLNDRCVNNIVYACPIGYIWEDSLNVCIDDAPDPSIQSPQVIQFTGNCDAIWVADYNDDIDDNNLPYPRTDPGCVEWAIRDYCGELYNPAIPDADRPVESVADEHFPNLPAVLVDVATNAQLGDPFKTVPALIYADQSPTGLLQDTTGDLRIGAMTFNSRGTAWEVDNSIDPDVTEREDFYGCGSGIGCTNRDGSIVIDYITDGGDTDSLVKSINAIKATTWTPMAEALYNAIGYYTRDKRLGVSDFFKKTDSADLWQAGTHYELGSLVRDAVGDVYWAITDSENASTGSADDLSNGSDTVVEWELLKKATDPDVVLDPVIAHCQSNNILVLTDGASTGDWNDVVRTFAATIANSDTDITDECGRFYGSTYVDDMAYYGQSGTDIYRDEQFVSLYGDEATKENIQTYVVTTGALRTDGTEDECRADVLLTETAEQGGTDRFYPGEDFARLKEQLTIIFQSLRTRASAGSAASVISSSRGGEGAIYQAIFWPEQEKILADGTPYNVAWVGDVHALFIDENGFMYEDTNDDRTMTPWDDSDNDNICDAGEGDCRVIVYYDASVERTRGCYNSSIFESGICDQHKEMEDIKFLWSVNDWLSDISDANIASNRSNYISSDDERYIFTWDDLSNDGVVDNDEVLEFVPGQDWAGMTVSGGRGIVPHDFNVNDNGEVDSIVSWIRGEEQTGFRSRTFAHSSIDVFTWRLGDVIHSTPMVVAAPAEGFNLLYHDLSYAEFVAKYKDRRQMIYFGANDGMLHAVNGGFYDEVNKKFWLGFDPDCDNYDDNGPDLGAELWAYVPYNLLPHLSSLTKLDYSEKHKYFVDQRPRIFDAQIFDPDSKHPNGWGTILVGGMRFGGAPVHAGELPIPEDDGVSKNPDNDNRVFSSAYFILDITDPESPPVLLGEMIRNTEDVNLDGNLQNDEDDNNSGAMDYEGVDLGYSTAIPTMVIMKDMIDNDLFSHHTSDWYLILGSGPHGDSGPNAEKALKGVSDQQGKVAILPLTDIDNNFSARYRNARIPDNDPNAIDGGRYLLPDNDSFVSDLITIDFDINPSTVDYMADAVYFGTVDGDFGFNGDGSTFWNGGGKLYRLITRDNDSSSFLHGRGIVQRPTTPDEWFTKPLIDANRPITGAPNVGYDNRNNFWVYFGTGRFFDAYDKTDTTQQKFYGIKEPMEWVSPGIREFTWATVQDNDTGTDPGEKGLVDVSEIIVQESIASPGRNLYCLDENNLSVLDGDGNPLSTLSSDNDCLPDPGGSGDPIKVFDAALEPNLVDYIAGADLYHESNECTSANDYRNCKDGWYKNFWPYNNRERNLGQSTLLGGLLLYTTYQPYSDVCRAEGQAYLYGLYYQTGTAWTESIFGISESGGRSFVKDKFSLGPGLATTPNLHVGSGGEGGDGPKAFVQTSTGEIKEIKQEVSPLGNFKTGRSKWKEYQRCN